MSQQPRIEEIVIPTRIGVFQDKKTKAKTIALPFVFPDGTNGVIMVTRLSAAPWIPSDTLVKVNLHYPPTTPTT